MIEELEGLSTNKPVRQSKPKGPPLRLNSDQSVVFDVGFRKEIKNMKNAVQEVGNSFKVKKPIRKDTVRVMPT